METKKDSQLVVIFDAIKWDYNKESAYISFSVFKNKNDVLVKIGEIYLRFKKDKIYYSYKKTKKKVDTYFDENFYLINKYIFERFEDEITKCAEIAGFIK